MLNSEFQARRANAVPRGVGAATSVFAAKAENATVWDVEGKEYVDFAGGIAVLNVGHRHPKVIAAVKDQLDAFTHTAFQVMAYPSYIELAERLNALAPIEGDAKTIFFTTGAEATENAVKVARAATGRPGIIAFVGGFHGRTALSSAMTGKVSPYKKGLGPLPGHVYHVPYPSEANGVTIEETLKALDFLFTADIEPEAIAAFILEPVQGEGGFNPAPAELWEALDALRQQYGIQIIADEVQTGFARTGKMLASESAPIKPDLISIAKSLGGGFPLSGLIGRAELMDAIAPGGLGGTYGGSPVAIAAALAVLDVIEEEDLCGRANAIGARLREAIAGFAQRSDLVNIAGLRGPGAMIAFDIVDAAGNPDGMEAKAVCARAHDAGLILLTCGKYGQAIRILVPLTVDEDTLEKGIALLEKALTPAGTDA